FSLAKERGALDAWQTDLERLNELVSDPMAASFLASPSVARGRKLAVIDRVLANAQPEARNLGRLLLERDRLEDVPTILALFEAYVRDERGIAVAEVTTAEPLSPEAQGMVRDRLQQLIGKQIELRLQVDPSIIGGLIASVGDLMIDGSVVSQLRKLRARLASAT
ncbi:MAG: ATP synthase F1 subunit delta, partial [Thermomicrobiales bacterium]|nr:ATP synthase F1 subunit delta [Thermomicrobiales bacterium]